MRVKTHYEDSPVVFYWISLNTWMTKSGGSFVMERVYWRSRWTPFVRVFEKVENNE